MKIILFSILLSTFSFATSNLEKIRLQEAPNRLKKIGKVIKIKGNATIIDELNRSPAKIVLNQTILNDSSLYCEKNCYLTIELFTPYSFIKIGQSTSLFIHTNEKHYKVKLNQGYIKTLFKSSEQIEKMTVETSNSITDISNSKSLFIYSPLVRRTSLINYKGQAIFKSKYSPDAKTLDNNQFSSVRSKMKKPKNVKNLTPKRLKRLQSAFNITHL